MTRKDKGIALLAALLALVLTGSVCAAIYRRLHPSPRVVDIAASEVVGEGRHAFGDPNSPYTLVEFGDYECPACRMNQPVVRALIARYPGRLRLVYRHCPLPLHANALTLARAAECARTEGRFWAVHESLMQPSATGQMSVGKFTRQVQSSA